ncbi:MAG TPA: FmdB family zinc ribbon protein [Candidatus Limnocylindria bacterium]|nr:FmdB family zinc ribbon protein [Candidatus Limnocylindria bacterium]
MPTYDYQCRSCGTITEVIHSMLEDGPSICERCGGELRRVLYPTGIIFKGPGFYSTDSRNGSSSSSRSSSTSTGDKPGAASTSGETPSPSKASKPSESSSSS